jgi:hypothetical protein
MQKFKLVGIGVLLTSIFLIYDVAQARFGVSFECKITHNNETLNFDLVFSESECHEMYLEAKAEHDLAHKAAKRLSNKALITDHDDVILEMKRL